MINVLDHGFVRLHNSMGNDLEIVRVARQSYDAAWRAGQNEANDAKLIHYLWKNRHTTPFEAAIFMFEVSAPIFVLRQWQRHRTWAYMSINEVSARYRELPRMFYTPDASSIGEQSKNSKQARVISDVVKPSRKQEIAAYKSRCEASFREYEWLLAQGWPRELARIVLPLSTYSHLFMKVDLNNLFHFLDLRTHEHAQWETQQYANAITNLIEPIVPVALEAWKCS